MYYLLFISYRNFQDQVLNCSIEGGQRPPFLLLPRQNGCITNDAAVVCQLEPSRHVGAHVHDAILTVCDTDREDALIISGGARVAGQRYETVFHVDR